MQTKKFLWVVVISLLCLVLPSCAGVNYYNFGGEKVHINELAVIHQSGGTYIIDILPECRAVVAWYRARPVKYMVQPGVITVSASFSDESIDAYTAKNIRCFSSKKVDFNADADKEYLIRGMPISRNIGQLEYDPSDWTLEVWRWEKLAQN